MTCVDNLIAETTSSSTISIELARDLAALAPDIMKCWDDATRADAVTLGLARQADIRRFVEQTLARLPRILIGELTGPPTPFGSDATLVILNLRALRSSVLVTLDREPATSSGVRRDLVLAAFDTELSYVFDQDGSDGTAATAGANYLEMARMDLESLREEREVREKFISALSHDLRHPLSLGIAGTELLLGGFLDAGRAADVVGKIRVGLQRAESMIRDLLDANRMRIGHLLPLRPTFCVLNEILRDTVDELTLTHGDRFRLRILGEIEGYWEADGIRRIVENLAGNAVKYGSPATPILVTALRQRDFIRITVHNEGPPIPADRLARLFEPFTGRREPGPAKGWGLGLTLVKGLCEAHGGRIQARSAEGEGTDFIVEIPIRVVEPQAKEFRYP